MNRKIFYLLLLIVASLQAFAQSVNNYTYDNLNRLTSVTYSNGTTVNYTYDALGNRLTKTVTVISQPATVVTADVTQVNSNSATCGGNVTSNGGSEVTQRGVCWSTSHNPTTDNAYTTDGTGTGSFTSNIAGLLPTTTYYVRAYAINSNGTAYGEEKTFTTTCGNVNVTINGNSYVNYGQSTTLTASGAVSYIWSTGQTGATITVTPSETTTYTVTGTDANGCTGTASLTVSVISQMPSVITTTVAQVDQTSAICGGIVTSDGGAEVVERGVCWSTSHNPVVTDAHTSDGTGTGNFQSSMTGLTTNTTYYVRAFATNSQGTAYGEEQILTMTSSPLPVIIFYLPESDVCNSHAPIVLGDYATVPTVPNATIVFSGTGVTDNIFYPSAVNTEEPITIYANYHNPATGQDANTATADITVHAPVVLTVDYSPIDTVYPHQLPLHLTGGHPEGGWFSGPFVDSQNSLFDPPTNGIATLYTLFYEYDSPYGCYSSTSWVMTVMPTSPVIVPDEPDVTLHPNPTNGKATVTWNNAQAESVELMDVTGRVLTIIEKPSGNSVVLNLGRLPNGTYFVRIRWNGRQQTSTYKLIRK